MHEHTASLVQAGSTQCLGEGVEIYQVGKGAQVSAPPLITGKITSPFNVTVDLPSTIFPYFWRQVNESHCYHFSSCLLPTDNSALSLLSAYCIVHLLTSKTVSFLSLLWVGRPQRFGSVPHPLLFNHIVPSSLPIISFHHQFPRAIILFKNNQTRRFSFHIFAYFLPPNFGSIL